MIFITLGSQKFQFNRLLKAMDDLVKRGVIKDEVFAQTGYSDYLPEHFGSESFLDRDEFMNHMKKSDVIVTHGGTGAIVTALKNNKRVMAMARLAEFNEHVDDHQVQIVEAFDKLNLIAKVESELEIESVLKTIFERSFENYVSNTENIISSIEVFILNLK